MKPHYHPTRSFFAALSAGEPVLLLASEAAFQLAPGAALLLGEATLSPNPET
jgi:hypothetical protein